MEHVTTFGKNKKSVTQAMRDPLRELGSLDCIHKEFWGSEHDWKQVGDGQESTVTQKGITRLALQVKEAVDCDPLCGPSSDRAKHFIGIEYEMALEHMLNAKGRLFCVGQVVLWELDVHD